MAKFYGEIGYGKQVETSPGKWQEVITIRNYSGDVIRSSIKSQSGNTLNDNMNADNRISILADHFAYDNLSTMRYIKWMGVLWKINSVEIQRPRLILTIGGVYNEQTIGATPTIS